MSSKFSAQAALYAKYRPEYPASLAEKLSRLSPQRELAWDCGTGSGQFAKLLSPHFTTVLATDVSDAQLANAVSLPNVKYSCLPAEAKLPVSDHTVDIVTIAQALHWFDFPKFYVEVRRACRPGGLIAAITYGVASFDNADLNAAFRHFYHDIVGPYWDKERAHVDAAYTTIPFPFERVDVPTEPLQYEWSCGDFIGYLKTWSAVQHYQRARGVHPVDEHEETLVAAFEAPKATTVTVTFPLIVLCGRVQ